MKKLLAFLFIWYAACTGMMLAQSTDTAATLTAPGTWVSEKPGVNLMTGEKLLVIHLIVFNADGTYKTMVKTAQKDQSDLGGSPVSEGRWFTADTPDGKHILCAQYNAGTWCASFEIDDHGQLQWGTGIYLHEPDSAVKEVAPEILGLPPLPYTEQDSLPVVPPKPKAPVDPDSRVG